MKLSLLGTIALVMTASCVKLPASPTRVEQAEIVKDKSVALVMVHEKDVKAYCTGVWVSENVILTANHCIAENEIGESLDFVVPADVRDPTSIIPTRRAVVYARDEEHDLASLWARTPPSPHGRAVVTTSPVLPGQGVQQVGNPLGLWWSYTSGFVSAVRFDTLGVKEAEQRAWWIQATPSTGPGNSGGGLFNENLELVGICEATNRRVQGINWFVHPIYIGDFLSRQGVQ